MNADTNQADRLLDELDKLRQRLNRDHNHTAIALEQDELDLDLDLREDIPLLEDRVFDTPGAQEIASQPVPDDSIINQLVDDLVAEYLPILEQRLRQQLLAALSKSI